jgi:hypothetical protein
MATKYFCDECGHEITEKNRPAGENGRLTGRHGVIHFQIIIGRQGRSSVSPTWNDGDFCAPCIRRAVVEGTP